MGPEGMGMDQQKKGIRSGSFVRHLDDTCRQDILIEREHSVGICIA